MSKDAFSSSSMSADPQDSWMYRALGDQNFVRQQGFFAWWYRFTSPPNAEPDATPQQRDRIRRCRLASALMLFLGTVLLIAGAIGAASPNHTILLVCISMMVAIMISIPLNRTGRVELVGLLLTLGITTGMYTSVVVNAFSVGMSPNDKDILYLLFFSELFAGAILPVNWGFLVAFMNVVFSFLALKVFPHDLALSTLLATSFPVIFPRLVQIHIISSGVMWILVNNLKAAIRRADRAEVVARLQHDMTTMAHEQVREKQALECYIDEIVTVHIQVANGKLDARVAYTEGNTLWKLAGPLNTLLGRYQHAKQAEDQMQHFSQHMTEAQIYLRQEISAAMQEQRPIQLPTTSPILAPFYQELQGKYITQSLYQPLQPSHHRRLQHD